MILVYFGRWSYERFKDDNNIFYKMKNDLTTGTWQDDIWCPIIIILFCTYDAPLHCAKFVWIKLSDIPDEVIREYKLREKATKKWKHLNQSQVWHLRPTSSRTLGHQPPQKTPQQTRIPAKQIGTGTLETRHKTHTVDTGCWWFWCQILRQRTCTTSQECTRRTLQTYMRLDRQTIHRDNIGLGL